MFDRVLNLPLEVFWTLFYIKWTTFNFYPVASLETVFVNPLRANSTMVKHTQTIRRQKPTNCLTVLDHFVGLAVVGNGVTQDTF